MKQIAFLIALTAALSMVGKSQQFIVGTFNLRYDNPKDTGNLWVNRAPVVSSLLRFHEFDIVGTQEGLRNQLDDMLKDLPEYACYGAGRDDGRSKGEHSAILYKKDRFSLLESGDFWLSETPDKVGYGWDAQLNRICSWVKLKNKSNGKIFYVFNVHFDHRGVVARVESGKLVVKKIQSIAGKSPVIFTGDFNGTKESEWYKFIDNSDLLEDALHQAKHPYIPNGSFNSFQSLNPSNDIIDHIFITKQFTVNRYGILTDTYHGRFPSDHYPVLVTLEIK